MFARLIQARKLNGLYGLLVLVLLLSLPGRAAAQAQPPNRFFGSTQVGGNEQPEGTAVEAYVGNTLCGSSTVQNRNGSLIYVVDVLGDGQKPSCGKDGDTVRFRVAGVDAKETGKYETAAATHLDLTATGAPRQITPPTVLAPGTGGTPAPPPNATPEPAQTPAETGTVSPEATGTPEAAATATPTAVGAATVTATPATEIGRSTATARSQSRGRPAGIWLFLVAIVILAAGALLANRMIARRRRR